MNATIRSPISNVVVRPTRRLLHEDPDRPRPPGRRRPGPSPCTREMPRPSPRRHRSPSADLAPPCGGRCDNPRKSVKNGELYRCPRSGIAVRGAEMAVAPFRQRRGGEVRGALPRESGEQLGARGWKGGAGGGVPATIGGPEGPRRGSVPRHAFGGGQRCPEPSGRRPPATDDRATHPAGGRRAPGSRPSPGRGPGPRGSVRLRSRRSLCGGYPGVCGLR